MKGEDVSLENSLDVFRHESHMIHHLDEAPLQPQTTWGTRSTSQIGGGTLIAWSSGAAIESAEARV
jgi:hypothetical protein